MTNKRFTITPLFFCITLFVKMAFNKEIKSEFCLWETFKPECSSYEIAFINQAKYGRMNIGKCLEQAEIEASGIQGKDPRYYGCYNDVTELLGNKCHFNKDCEMKVSDLEKLKSEACFPGLKMYLEVDYSCLPIIDKFDGCYVYLSSKSRYLNHISADVSTCGTSKKPLVIEAPKGQRIKVTHMSISKSNSNSIGSNGHHCHDEIGVIMDKKRNVNTTICPNGFLKTSSPLTLETIFESKENFISIIFYSPNQNQKLLFEIKAEGCLDIIPPEDTWLKRNGDDIVIGCYSSKQTWYLRCENGQWVGAIGNCSDPKAFVTKLEVDKSQFHDDVVNVKLNISPVHQTLIVVAISGFGLVVCLAIVCMGVLCLRKLNSKDAKCQAYYNIGPNLQGCSTYKQSSDHMNHGRTPGFDDSLLAANTRGRPRQTFNGGVDNMVVDDRYQVLDKDEVAKESMTFA